MPPSKTRRKYKKLKTQKIHTTFTNEQDGGIKVIMGRTDDASDPNNNPLNRQLLSSNAFLNVLNLATNVNLISRSSLSSFVINLHLPEDPVLFRSDTIDEDNEYLQVKNIMDEVSGKIIRNVVMKICILKNTHGNQRVVTPDYVTTRGNKQKEAVHLSEFNNEYEIQRYLYSSMMSFSGNPFCPDAFGVITIPDVNGLSIFNTLIGRIQPNNEFNNVFRYLSDLYTRNLFVGIILMDTIPTNYLSLDDFSPSGQSYDRPSYLNLCSLVLSIYILTIYRGKLFLLDAHPGNWLCNPAATELQRVKAIDFGRVYRINSIASIHSLNRSINIDIRTFFDLVRRENPADLPNLITGFLVIMNVPHERIVQYTDRYVNLDTQYSHVVRVFQEHIQDVINLFNTNTYFEKKLSKLTAEEREQNLSMIHRLTVISCLMDGFFNYYKFAAADRKSQFGHIVHNLFNTGVSTPVQIISERIMFNLESMNGRPLYTRLTEIYANVYSHIVQYNTDRLYPVIRNYSEFRERQRSTAQNALIRITPYVPQMFTTRGRFKNACVNGVCTTGSLLGKFTLGSAKLLGKGALKLGSLAATPFVYVGEAAINSMRPKPPPGFKAPRVVSRSPPMYGGNKKKRRYTHKNKYRNSRTKRRN
jgi:hypothetical protein